PEFPLFAHASGQWAKKIRGRLVYFDKWDDPDAALEKYNRDKTALHSGRKPREQTTGLTVKELINRFLNHKAELSDAGELSPRMFQDYNKVTDLLIENPSPRQHASLLSPWGKSSECSHRGRSKRWCKPLAQKHVTTSPRIAIACSH